MDQKLNTDEKMRIQKKFQANRKVIETILKQFTYK